MCEKGIIDIYIKTGRLEKWHIECNYKEDKVIQKYNFIKNEKIILKNIPKKNKNINKVIKQPRS